MIKKTLILFAAVLCLIACNKPSRVEQYKAEKHIKDSVGLFEQERTLTYYQSQLENLMPVADSLIALFKYEKNEKYQDHGYYVLTRNDLRFLVRDDGQDLLIYKDGKRTNSDGLQGKDLELLDRAEHLQIVISDVNELEKRIRRTSLEVQKYQKRLQKEK